MVATLESELSTGAAIVSIAVDGTTVRYDRRQALEELKYWRNRLASLNGKRPRVGQINLG